MSFPVKPGDTFTARYIGTYPELPEFDFDTKEADPQFYAEREFTETGGQIHRYGGPKGEIVVTYEFDTGFVHTTPDGVVLRHVAWDAATSTWKDVA